MMQEAECPFCACTLATDCDECPGCGKTLVICGSQRCAKAYPSEQPTCIYCDTPNPRLAGRKEENADPLSAHPLGVPAEPEHLDKAPVSSAVETIEPALMGGHIADEPDLASIMRAMAANQQPAAKQAPATLMTASAPMAPRARSAPRAPLAPPVPSVVTSLDPQLPQSGESPVLIELDTGGRPLKGRQSLLRVRLTGQSTAGELRVELTIESPLFPEPIRLSTLLEPGTEEELAGPRFIPTVSGSEHIRVSVTVVAEDDVPLGRWSGNWILAIRDPEKQQQSISAGGDVIIMGGPGVTGLDTVAGYDAADTENWQQLVLRIDREFRRRLRNACPTTHVAMPPMPRDREQGDEERRCGRTAAIVHLDHAGERRSVLFEMGKIAHLGRGGKPGVNWCLKPSPFDAYHYGRISGTHCSIAL